jgi:hypothetical protein
MNASASSDYAPNFHLYLDDSGSRMLNRLSVDADARPQWFALGGLLVREEDEQKCKDAHDALYARWPQMTGPLHLTDMYSQTKKFAWLGLQTQDERNLFWRDFHEVLSSLPVIGQACVVHRPGYRDRGYGSRQGDARWDLCRTAFNILIERSAKIAANDGRRLRVKYEGSDRAADHALRSYWALLKAGNGLGFNANQAQKYDPFPPEKLAATLIDMERKTKTNKILQFADTFVLSVSRGRYEPTYGTFVAVRNAGLLADDVVGPDRAAAEGIKYSCFDGV